jgi:uncharacterized protein
MSNYYVYVYIDPRNFEEFYYGKGCGSRKDAHLFEESDSAKSRRIQEIKKAGLNPIIRVIARDLSEAEALLVEKTLLWKLGKLTTNIATGHFAEKFRPHSTLHKELSGFDFENGLFYYNVGECKYRNWDDYLKFGFISAGQGLRWRDAILGFNQGDVFFAYLKRHGFVGLGKITQEAVMARNLLIDGKSLLSFPLSAPQMSANSTDEALSEYVCLVDWIRAVPRAEAKKRSTPKLFTTTHVRASLDGQPETVRFLEGEFGINVRDFIA